MSKNTFGSRVGSNRDRRGHRVWHGSGPARANSHISVTIDLVEEEVRLTELELPGGAIVMVRVRGDGGSEIRPDSPGMAGLASAGGRLKFEDVADSVRGVAAALKDALAEATPDKTEVELGFAVSTKAGKATAVLVDGSMTAEIRVVLSWERKPEQAS